MAQTETDSRAGRAQTGAGRTIGSAGQWFPANCGRRMAGKLAQLCLVACLSVWGEPLSARSQLLAADVADATELYHAGRYRECSEMAGRAIDAGEYSETWRVLKIRADTATGHYRQAQVTLEAALRRFRTSIRLRWLGHTVYQLNGRDARAGEMLDEIDILTDGASWRYSDPLSRVTLGRFLLKQGADPREVLEAVYNEVKNRTRSFPEPFVAAGELALQKHDYGLAAEEYAAALKLDARNPDIHFGLARAFATSDAKKAEEHLEAALRRNPRHVDSLLFLVENHLDAERYDEARRVLAQVAAVNVLEPRSWAYRAVLAHLDNDRIGEEVCRGVALGWWSTNPEVDYIIGRKLSQKYRFAEGAAYQRRSLALDAEFLPAKIALSQDLLRLGREEEGWRMASEVYERDGYNVVAHNLVTLHDHLADYRTLQRGRFIVRMAPGEASVYGPRVLELLERAESKLSSKYEVDIQEPILVEIFPRQQDFAIRTFGLPGGAGFLGVCFGLVITANSPASQGDHPANWESVLWHEYCHVVTLHKTRNRMPRWLSEGISVYEELQENRAWGQSMTPEYRAMILGDDLTPVSGLSGAFLEPKSPLHLQFAYFESAMVVEYLVEKYGFETLKRILVDLGVGMPINEALERYTGSLSGLDQEFAAHARRRAESLAAPVDWQRGDLPEHASSIQLERWNAQHPDNYWGLQRWAAQLLTEGQWQAAKQPLRRLIELFPQNAAENSAYVMLATVHRKLGETKQERAVLESLALRSSNATDAYLRLMELAAEEEDWEAVRKNAQRMLAVNPLQRAPHRYLTQAAEQLGDDALAVEGLRVLALMDPLDPADIHYRLASRLHRLGELADARRHILESLEEAPRFRAAHHKLLDILRDLQSNQDPTDSEAPVEAREEKL